MFFFINMRNFIQFCESFYLSLMLSCRVNPYPTFWLNRFIIRGHFCDIISAKIQFYGNEVKSELMCDICPFFHLTIQKKSTKSVVHQDKFLVFVRRRLPCWTGAETRKQTDAPPTPALTPLGSDHINEFTLSHFPPLNIERCGNVTLRRVCVYVCVTPSRLHEASVSLQLKYGGVKMSHWAVFQLRHHHAVLSAGPPYIQPCQYPLPVSPSSPVT